MPRPLPPRRLLTPLLLLIPLLLLSAACDRVVDIPIGDGDGTDTITRTYTFESSDEGWEAGFVDFSTVQDSSLFDFIGERRPLPDHDATAFYLAGTNRSDDLFMYLKRPIRGLQPNTTYEVTLAIDLYSNVPSECVGIGGSPGGSVYVKVGAAATEPEPVVTDGDVRLNVDKGNQSTGGSAAVVVGDVATSVPGCPDDTAYQLLERSNLGAPLTATTGSDGTLWVFAGTDSGFEGRTMLYYDSIRVTLRPQR